MAGKSYKTELREDPFTLEGKNGVDSYVLREMDGKDRDTFLEKLSNRVQIVDGKPVPKGMHGLDLGILALSVYTDEGVRVARKVIEKWPGSVVDALGTDAMTLNGLGAAGEESAGND